MLLLQLLRHVEVVEGDAPRASCQVRLNIFSCAGTAVGVPLPTRIDLSNGTFRTRSLMKSLAFPVQSKSGRRRPRHPRIEATRIDVLAKTTQGATGKSNHASKPCPPSLPSKKRLKA
jgi:hypothetical protein